MDGQRQNFAIPKIPQLTRLIAKRHATPRETLHHDGIKTILSATGFGSVVFHAHVTEQNRRHKHNPFLPFL
jgi:hypothetical protein